MFNKQKPLSDLIERELYEAERMLLNAEGELENAIGRRDTLLQRRNRLRVALNQAQQSEAQSVRESMRQGAANAI